METALRRIADTLAAALDAAAAWFATDAWRPENWPGATWGLVVAFVVLLALLLWRRRAPRGLEVRPPQLLVTHGEVTPEPGGGTPPVRRRGDPVVHADAGGFTMTVSNLSRYPVQLLEVAVRDDRRGAPRVAPVDAVVPALGSVSVSGRLPLALRGDGWLDLYCYAAAPRVKLHRHRAELVWEPWSARFKAVAVEQTTAPTRRLASDEPGARFADDRADPAGAPAPAAPAGPTAAPEAPPTVVDAAPVAARRPSVAPLAAPPAAAVPAARPRPERPRRTPAAPAPAAELPARGVGEAAPPATAASPVTEPGAVGTGVGAREVAVPRIGTPPVGLAVTGRGGAADRTPDGVPIGRPSTRSAGSARVPGPTADDAEPVRRGAAPASGPTAVTPVGAAPPDRPAPSIADAPRPAPTAADTPRPAPTAADAPRPAPTAADTPRPAPTAADAPRPAPTEDPAPGVDRAVDRTPATEAPPARRRPKLEFPDEF